MDTATGTQHEEVEGKRKAFSPDLHNTYDWDGKLAVARYFGLKHEGSIEVWDPFGEYGIDLKILMPDGQELFIEVEVRPDCWSESIWKYPTVHFLERKAKYLKHEPMYLFALDDTFSHAMVVPGTVVREHKKIAVPNKYSEGELFYDIPIGECSYRWLMRGTP